MVKYCAYLCCSHLIKVATYLSLHRVVQIDCEPALKIDYLETNNVGQIRLNCVLFL